MLLEERDTAEAQLVRAQQIQRRDVLQGKLIRLLEDVFAWHALGCSTTPISLLDEVALARKRLAELREGNDDAE